jgi:hypothetical protein
MIGELQKWAEAHGAIVHRFGRFPHRNGVLGRISTPEEIEFLQQPDATSDRFESAARIFSKTDVLQQFGWMSADRTLSGVCGLAFAVELNERAYQNRVLVR